MKSLRIPAEHDVADMQNHPEFLAKAGVDVEGKVLSAPFASMSKDFRTAYDLTQMQLAEIADTTQATVSRWEKGELEPSLMAWARMCEFAAARGDTIRLPFATSPQNSEPATYIWALAGDTSCTMTRAEAEREALATGQPCIVARVVSKVKLTPSLEVVK